METTKKSDKIDKGKQHIHFNLFLHTNKEIQNTSSWTIRTLGILYHKFYYCRSIDLGYVEKTWRKKNTNQNIYTKKSLTKKLKN